MVSIGIGLFAFEKVLPTRYLMKPLAIAFVVSCFIASYTVVDGLRLLRSEKPYSYIA
jgi:hypothetical protein